MDNRPEYTTKDEMVRSILGISPENSAIGTDVYNKAAETVAYFYDSHSRFADLSDTARRLEAENLMRLVSIEKDKWNRFVREKRTEDVDSMKIINGVYGAFQKFSDYVKRERSAAGRHADRTIPEFALKVPRYRHIAVRDSKNY